MTDRIFEQIIKLQQRDMRSLVAGEHRWLLVRGFALFGLGIVALTTMTINGDSWWQMAASGYLGGLVGIVALGGLRRATAYRSGWLEGREAMIAALSESLRRGMTPQEWLVSEYTRDMATMGLLEEDS